MTAQASHTEMQRASTAVNFRYTHFAMLCIDHNGELRVEASPSIAGCEKAIFTEDVQDRFLKSIATAWQPNLQSLHANTLSHMNGDVTGKPMLMSSPSLAMQSAWYQHGLPRQTGLIPCEWQSLQNKRHRRSLRHELSGIGLDLDSASPTPTLRRTALRLGQTDLVRRYYEKAFEAFQQLNCRVIAKAFIKQVEPRKQVNHPYNGRRAAGGSSQKNDSELTKPKWWPTGVTHREPDHLQKAERIKLLVHILCELKETRGITAEKLRDAGQDVRRQIQPEGRLQILDEIYYVRYMEELYIDGKISGDTMIYVSHVHLDEVFLFSEMRDQTVNANSRELSLPIINGKPDAPKSSEDSNKSPENQNEAQAPADKSHTDIPVSSDERRLPPMEGMQQAKRPATQDYCYPPSPVSSPSISRKSSLESGLSTYSADMAAPMLSSSEPSRGPCAPRDLHPAESSCIPDYFGQQIAAPAAGQNPQSGYWSLPATHAPLPFNGY
ncbi:hypothetical protein BO94DRAFT_539825 [Aspergillus sclerotioniger CBS 115572]|uniref:Subtelomeric hrmA-associated cluster protein AFUB-079030/YDR124W-like helical bundle domain-containing protein n=1 Tax=Aspergillus sclerotioniger CBS 115572 TaxID=1450535 RepID=A0A317VEQ9_9EURO|nr:hypothetical protein BO94DRAFT_539825 [Aspergillus sclerotioniger CBS 115572]PWY70360.1 hypothetical protein BO94DRAFT_539825 [Aspergillus sclerotioniger CBS 115572]